MVGSAGIAALIASVAFWVLLVYGVIAGELRARGVVVVFVLWVAGRLLLPHIGYEPAHGMFSSYVAALDIALVFAIFKRDVRLFE